MSIVICQPIAVGQKSMMDLTSNATPMTLTP